MQVKPVDITKSFNSDNNLHSSDKKLPNQTNQNLIETLKEVCSFLESNSLKNIETPLKGTCLQITKDQTRAVFSSRALNKDSDLESEGARLAVIDLMSEEVVLDRTVCKKDILTIALSSDDLFIFAGGSDFDIFKVDLFDLRKVETFKGHTGNVKEICVSSDGAILFSASEDGTLRMWELDSRLQSFESLVLVLSTLELSTLDLGVGDNCLITGGNSGVLYFYEFFSNSRQGKVEKTLDLQNAITACKISVNYSYVITGDQFGNVKVFKFASWDLHYEFSMTDQITDLDISLNEDVLIAGSKNTNIKIWFLIKKKEINYNGHSECVQRCTFMKDNSRVVSISDDKNIKIWKIPEPEVEFEYFRQQGIQFEQIWFTSIGNVIHGVIFENSQLKVVSLDSNGVIFKSFSFSEDPEAKVFIDYSRNLILSSSSATSEQVSKSKGKPDLQSFLIELTDVNVGEKVKSFLIQKNFQTLFLTPCLKFIILGDYFRLYLVDFESLKITKTVFLNHQDVLKIVVNRGSELMFILGINQLTYLKTDFISNPATITEIDDKLFEEDIENSSLFISKNSRFLFILALKFCEIIHCKSFQTISKLPGHYNGFFQNINKTFFLYSQNFLKIYSMETFEHLTTIRKDFIISSIFLSSDFSQMFINTSDRIIKSENPLKTSKLTLVGDYTQLEKFQLCINSLFDRELETDISQTLWLIESVHVNLLHVFAYLNKPKLIIDSIYSEVETTSFINSREGYSALAVALKMNFIDCVDSIVKLLIKKLKNTESNNIIAQFMFKTIENDINLLNLLSYSKLHKLYSQIFTVDNSTYLPNYLPSHVKLPLMVKENELFIDTKEFGLEDFDDFSHMNSVVFKKTIMRLSLELGSTKSLEFLKSLSKCKNVKVFETQIISVILKDKWKKVRWVMFAQAGLYFGYLLFLALYNSNEVSRTRSFLIGAFLVNIVLYVYEIVFMMIDFVNYFKDFWNIVDTLRFFVMFSYSIMVWSEYFDISINKNKKERYMLGFLIFISWVRGLTYFRMAKATRYLTNLLFQVVLDITPFLLVIFYSFITYSLAFRAFSSNPNKDFFPYLTESYMIIIGEWENPIELNFYSFVFFTATLLNPIITLNLLIAIISKTFLGVKENQVVADSQELVEMIIEIETLMLWNRKNNQKKYLHLMQKEIENENESEVINWKIRKIRAKINGINLEIIQHDKDFEGFQRNLDGNSKRMVNAFQGRRASLRSLVNIK